MNLLYRWVGTSKGWKATTLKTEEQYIKTFWDIEEAKKILVSRKILPCSIKLFRLYNGVV